MSLRGHNIIYTITKVMQGATTLIVCVDNVCVCVCLFVCLCVCVCMCVCVCVCVCDTSHVSRTEV